MYFVLGGDGKEYGPAPMATLRNWVGEGRLNLESKVRRDGTQEWVALGEVPEYLGKVESAVSTPVDAGPFSPLDAYEKGWELFKKNVGLLVLTCLVFGVLNFLGSVIPLLSYVYVLFFAVALQAGVYRVVLMRIRGESASVGDLFSCFQTHFKDLAVISLVNGGLSLLLLQPYTKNLQLFMQHQAVPYSWGLALGLLLVNLVITQLLLLSPMLVIDRNLPAGQAILTSMKLALSNAGRLIVMAILSFLVLMLGIIALFFGVLFAAPVVMAAYVFAYLQITRDLDNGSGS